ncbi:AtzE family amidohydrolase [Falsiroseomonas selenitidurans]|uniref:AtzE family amidohydrolase n=1 Tax=Falsiroseomonas selenitidurans TaxID=2716335 RepID=A0ABX1E8B7_9PROT|nr:AtzE family amidohydrolase [Falsiroseomonas selenitidurans]NKC33451.1 AtzE family amidohydrolase [Falsiroseomonas selenitidurans]
MNTAATIAAAIRTGRTTATATAEAALADIAARNAATNAFTAVTAARARAEAAAVDAAIAEGRDPGPLAGVPYAVKNLFDLAGLTTLAGAKIERDRPPAAQDAFLVRQFQAAGGVCLGALNMDEYAYGFTTENAHFGDCRNPHDLARVAGGSSGGSAAAVAAGLVPLTLGSDTNGSIRVPASLCGIFGLKPTYGRLSRRGSYPFVASLDHLGPFARDVGDLALAYDVLQGRDPADPAQQDRPVEPVSARLGAGIEGLRIAVADDHFARNGHAEAFEAVAVLARALGATRRVTIPQAALGRAAAFLITMSEGANLHLADLRERAADFDPGTRDRFLAGALLPAAWLVQAQRVREAYRAAVMAVFQQVDVVLAPATPFVAPPIGQAMTEIDGQILPIRPNLGVYTQPISCIGLPVLAVPLADPGAAGAPQGMPIGVQLIAAPWREDVLFRVAAALERAGIAAAPAPPA